MKTTEMKSKLALVVLTAILTACGGGGDNQSATATAAQQPAPAAAAPGDMTKYAGTWSTACMPEGQQSVRMTLALTSGSSKLANGRIIADGYKQANCGGPSAQVSFPFSASFIEMSGSAEKLNVSDGSENTIMLATFSADGRTLTLADGEDTFVFAKQ